MNQSASKKIVKSLFSKVIASTMLLLAACRADFGWKNGQDPRPDELLTPQTSQPSFSITTSASRIPVAGFQGSEVTITANCQNNGTINVKWDLGTGLAEQGLQIKKTFSNVGAVTIKATCTGQTTLQSETVLDVYYPGSGGTCQPGQPGCNGSIYPGPNQNYTWPTNQ